MKPILFNTEMVRALLEGKKTVTWRTLKPQPRRQLQNYPGLPTWGHLSHIHTWNPPAYKGALFYVLETWRVQAAHRFEADVKIMFKAGGPMTTICFPGGKSQDASREEYDAFISKWMEGNGWLPAIHMPKAAARIFLRVTDVRVDRLQDSSVADILREGIDGWEKDPVDLYAAWESLWDSTIKPADLDNYGWAASPWVWEISFERCEKPEAWT